MNTIRLGKTDSVFSTDKQNFLDVELKNTSKLGHFTDIKTTIDEYEQFTKERDNCNKYRLILTINPFCTNVLFNTLTEVVYAEGSDKCENIIDKNGYKADNVKNSQVYGVYTPTRRQMICDTEYSKICTAKNTFKQENYVYHPGYDIFDNHLLRNKSFKIVNKIKNKTGNGDANFNTLSDVMRYPDGSTISTKTRRSLNDVTTIREKHLYMADEVLSYEDSINANLTEENGWYGFINNSTIQSKNPMLGFENLGISRVLNDHKACEFIDMYPDRTLYSFTPKFNEYRHRLEQNWDVILTYPYKKTDDYPIVSATDSYNKKINSMIILTVEKVKMSNGNDNDDDNENYVIMFRTLTRHGLRRGDYVRFYYKIFNSRNGKVTWETYQKDFLVANVGDLNRENNDFYFYITDKDFIKYINEDDDTILDLSFRFARVVNGQPCQYYIRKFKKLPNFKLKKENFSWDNYTGNENVDEYIDYVNNYVDKNCVDEDNKTLLFDKEQYKLGFASTIYTDDTTQITFTDTIDVENLVDEFGNPLTEIYATIIKSNRGHEEWYGTAPMPEDKTNIEFSHCFGKVSCGLLYSQDYDDINPTKKVTGDAQGNLILDYRTVYGDVASMYYINDRLNNMDNNSDFIFGEEATDITVDDDEFFGDLIEFTPGRAQVRVLQPFFFRFNTRQREIFIEDNSKQIYDKQVYHEIVKDDYDIPEDNGEDPFKVNEIIDNSFNGILRPEGYYYQPHYRIPIREFGTVKQASHMEMTLSSISPVQMDGIYLKLVCTRNMKLDVGDSVYLCDDVNNKTWEFVISYVENRVTYYVIPKCPMTKQTKQVGNETETFYYTPWQYFYEKANNWSWFDIIERVRTYNPYSSTNNDEEQEEDKNLVFRKINEEIPYYAVKPKVNTYLWRTVLRPGDSDAVELPEYSYANDAFYISNVINFYLRRQDPKGWNGLYADSEYCLVQDISGNIRRESNYSYKDETEMLCGIEEITNEFRTEFNNSFNTYLGNG